MGGVEECVADAFHIGVADVAAPPVQAVHLRFVQRAPGDHALDGVDWDDHAPEAPADEQGVAVDRVGERGDGVGPVREGEAKQRQHGADGERAEAAELDG